MEKKISKLTLTAKAGVLKDLISEIVFHKDLMKFEKNFSASKIETKIFITGKKDMQVNSEDWDFLQNFVDQRTKNLLFTKSFEY